MGGDGAARQHGVLLYPRRRRLSAPLPGPARFLGIAVVSERRGDAIAEEQLRPLGLASAASTSSSRRSAEDE
jgi:hypothetical protein